MKQTWQVWVNVLTLSINLWWYNHNKTMNNNSVHISWHILYVTISIC